MTKSNIILINNGLRRYFFFFLSFLLIQCTSDIDKNIVIGNDNFIYEIGHDGKNLHFIDKITGIDYLDSGTASKCAYIIIDGIRKDITAVSLKKNHLLNGIW